MGVFSCESKSSILGCHHEVVHVKVNGHIPQRRNFARYHLQVAVNNPCKEYFAGTTTANVIPCNIHCDMLVRQLASIATAHAMTTFINNACPPRSNFRAKLEKFRVQLPMCIMVVEVLRRQQ